MYMYMYMYVDIYTVVLCWSLLCVLKCVHADDGVLLLVSDVRVLLGNDRVLKEGASRYIVHDQTCTWLAVTFIYIYLQLILGLQENIHIMTCPAIQDFDSQCVIPTLYSVQCTPYWYLWLSLDIKLHLIIILLCYIYVHVHACTYTWLATHFDTHLT